MPAATYREVELHENRTFHQVLLDLKRERLGERVKLTRLDRDQTEELLGALFSEDITPEFLENIYSETEGNPFFIEEVCKALADSGALFFRDGKWAVLDMNELGVPQSVQIAIQSRVEELEKG